MLAPIPKTRALLMSVSLVFLSYLMTPEPPVTSTAFPKLIPLTVLFPMEGIRILNGVWSMVEEFDTVIKFAEVSVMEGDAAWARLNVPAVVINPGPVFVNRPVATVNPTDVTDPVPAEGFTQFSDVPFDAKYCPAEPTDDSPVPPDDVEIGVLEVNVPVVILPELSSPDVKTDLFTEMSKTDKTILLLKATA